jgi:hypothetical protein
VRPNATSGYPDNLWVTLLRSSATALQRLISRAFWVAGQVLFRAAPPSKKILCNELIGGAQRKSAGFCRAALAYPRKAWSKLWISLGKPCAGRTFRSVPPADQEMIVSAVSGWAQRLP